MLHPDWMLTETCKVLLHTLRVRISCDSVIRELSTFVLRDTYIHTSIHLKLLNVVCELKVDLLGFFLISNRS